jgi:hypothetical protein
MTLSFGCDAASLSALLVRRTKMAREEDGWVTGILILRIENLMVSKSPSTSNGVAALFSATMTDGEKVTMGLSPEALEEFCRALIENSPRTPGTPGRN